MVLNRKGFMLAEVIVVSVVIATVLVTLFTGINNVSNAYSIRNKYYDVDSLFVAMEINDILISNYNVESYLNNNNVFKLSGGLIDNYMTFYRNSTGYDVSSSYFVPYSSDKLNVMSSMSINQTFKDYIDYLKGNLDFKEDYTYMIIVERRNVSDINDCYYYVLKLNY